MELRIKKAVAVNFRSGKRQRRPHDPVPRLCPSFLSFVLVRIDIGQLFSSMPLLLKIDAESDSINLQYSYLLREIQFYQESFSDKL